MTHKMLHNKAQLMNSINRKKMYKKGKNWVVAGVLLLSLLGGTAVATHADTNVQASSKQSPFLSILGGTTAVHHINVNANPQNNSSQSSVVNTTPKGIQAKARALQSTSYD